MNTLTAPHLDLVEQALLAAGNSAPDTVESLLSLPKIKIFTDALKAYEGANGERVFRCTASSTIKDLHGDFMTEDCVRDMSLQARKGPTNNGLTIFLNHSYKVPEDVAGKVASAQVLTRAKDDLGADIWDMDYEVRLATGSDRIKQTWNLIYNDEITLGISIGAYILEYDFVDKEEGYWGGLIINKVLLVETSIVGIPANQRSWIQNGVISIGESLGFSAKQIRRVLDGKETAPLMKTASAPVSLAAGLVTTTDMVVDKSGAPIADARIIRTIVDQPLNAAGEPDGEPTTEVITLGEMTEDATTETESESSDSPEVNAEAAPETESTAEQTTESDPETQSGELTGEVAASDDPALAAVAPEVALSLSAGTTPAVELVLAALESAAKTVSELRTEKAKLEGHVKELTGARDQAIKDRDDAAEIIALVARSPLGRKTQFAGPVQSFQARFAGIYDAGFLKLIDETE